MQPEEMLFTCPDCGQEKLVEESRDGISFLVCNSCQLIYPILDGIYILMPVSSRSYDLELTLIDSLSISDDDVLYSYKKNTKRLLVANKGKLQWAWEDEQFWSQHYEEEMAATVSKNWSLTIRQRKWIASELSPHKANIRTVLDVGSGEGQNFRSFIQPLFDEEGLYIALDVSLNALKLNRSRNPHQNALYVLGNADVLPFTKGDIDLMCFFGILHHTEMKARSLPRSLDMLSTHGHFVLHEALVKPNPSDYIWFLRKADGQESAHEERVERKELYQAIETANVRILKKIEFFTIIFGFFRRLMKVNRILESFLWGPVFLIDRMIASTVGKAVPFFSSGDIIIVGEAKSK